MMPIGPLLVPCPPLGNGEPAISVMAPVVELSEKAEMVQSAVFAV